MSIFSSFYYINNFSKVEIPMYNINIRNMLYLHYFIINRIYMSEEIKELIVEMIKEYLTNTVFEVASAKEFLDDFNSSDYVLNVLEQSTFSRIINKKVKLSSKLANDLMHYFAQIPTEQSISFDEFIEVLLSKGENFGVLNDYLNKRSLKLGSGFTTWAAKIIAPLYNKSENGLPTFTENIQFTLSKYNKSNTLKWMKSGEIPKNEGFDFTTSKFIGLDIKEALNDRLIDGAFLLKSTFEHLYQNELKKPILLSRMATGFGTTLYVIWRGENKQFIQIKKLSEKTSTLSGKYELLEVFKNVFSTTGKNATIFKLNNFTIKTHLKVLLEFLNLSEDQQKKFGVENIYLPKAFYETGIEHAREILDKNEVLLFAGFEPFNFNFLKDLEKKGKDNLNFAAINLSELIGERTSYCLYVWPETLKSIDKLKAIRELIVANANLVNDESYIKELTCLFNIDHTAKEERENCEKIIKRDIEKMKFHENRLDFVNYLIEHFGEGE